MLKLRIERKFANNRGFSAVKDSSKSDELKSDILVHNLNKMVTKYNISNKEIKKINRNTNLLTINR